MPNNKSIDFPKKFAQLDGATRDALAQIGRPMQAGLAALVLLDELAPNSYFSISQIVACLEEAGVAINPKTMAKAFASVGGRVSRREGDGGDSQYRIMTSGRREAEPLLSVGNLSVTYIENGTPRTARKVLKELLAPLKGEVLICDPYYGLRSLEALEMISKSSSVRFLTATLSEKDPKWPNALRDFKQEYPNVEIRVIGNPKLLHDRYALSPDALLLLGHGIKDIGNRESFVIRLPAEYAADMIDSLKANFNNRWASASQI